MQIFKYALRNITRTKGRSILIGIIVIIISFAMCVGLCIRQGIETSKEEALEDITITAQISPDRSNAMEALQSAAGSSDDSDLSEDSDVDLSEAMADELTLEELEVYAAAESVQSFYYVLTAYFDGSDITAYSTSSSSDGDTDSDSSEMSLFSSASGDFTVEGYSSDEAMTDFVDGTKTITDGSVFDEGTSEMVCIISDELAEYNSLSVGDTITICSTEDEDETYTLEIVGIYTNSQASAEASFSMGGMSSDPANSIYVSYETLNSIVSSSDTLTSSLTGTYVLGDTDAYESFVEEVAELGLSDDYTVSSTDLEMYETSYEMLDNISDMAGYFVLVIVLIGAAILIVLNIFSTRERKYEIGVLTAIGMKKKKVAQLFMTEILIITIAGTIIGGGLGAVLSVPITDSLMSSQTESAISESEELNQSFGRDFNAPSDADIDVDDDSSIGAPSGIGGGAIGGAIGNYATEITASVNLVVLVELLGLGIMLAIIAGMVSVIAIMRYEPLQILSNRD